MSNKVIKKVEKVEKPKESKITPIFNNIVRVLNFLIPIITPFVSFVLMEYVWRIDKKGEFASTPFANIASGRLIFLNIVIFYLLWVILTSIIGNSHVSSIILIVLTFVIGMTNYFLMLFRTSPLLLADIKSVETAMAVQNNYEFTMSNQVYIMIIYAIIAILANIPFGFKIPKLKEWWQKLIIHIAPAVVAILALVGLNAYIAQPTISDRIPEFNSILFTPQFMCSADGYMLSTLYQFQFLSVKEPDGYSIEKAQKLLKKYDSDSVWDNDPIAPTSSTSKTFTSPKEKVDVLVIMNESFSDIKVNGTFKTNKDYMPYIRSLMTNAPNTISGYMYSSVLAGSTANTEYEYLTGNSMAFLPQGSIAYQQYVDHNINSQATQAKAQGYSTFGTHPYVSYGWKRSTVYPLLGFDNIYFKRDMTNISSIRCFASDDSYYKYLERSIISQKSPYYAFNVTMQNHGGYGGYPELLGHVQATEMSNPYLDAYITLIKYSDDAFKSLINYIKTIKKPTLVVMFGDHQPNDSVVSSIYSAKGQDAAKLSGANRMVRYKVPVIMWANYPIPEEHQLETSAIYLSGMVNKLAGIPTNNYQNFLETLRKDIPVISTQGYYDKNMTFHNIDDITENKLVKDYQIIQYYKMFDEKK